MENKETIFYTFKDGSKQNSNVIKCIDLQQAHDFFNIEYARLKNNECKWDYFDITVNGKLLRSSKF